MCLEVCGLFVVPVGLMVCGGVATAFCCVGRCDELPGLAIATGAISLFVFIFLRIKLDELPDMVEGRHCRRLYLLIPLIVLAPLLLATLGLGSTTSRPEERELSRQQFLECNSTAERLSFVGENDDGEEVVVNYTAKDIVNAEYALFTIIWVFAFVGLLALLRAYLATLVAFVRAISQPRPPRPDREVADMRGRSDLAAQPAKGAAPAPELSHPAMPAENPPPYPDQAAAAAREFNISASVIFDNRMHIVELPSLNSQSRVVDAEAALERELSRDPRFAGFSAGAYSLVLIHNAKRLPPDNSTLASHGVVGGTSLHVLATRNV